MILTAFEDFGSFDGRIWLNCAHQGPLPRVAVEAAQEALFWKIAPHRIADDAFHSVPLRLKNALGRLINAPPEDIILANSTSYGLHLLANGIPWQAGDEVLLVEGDFPANILPWLGLRKRGVVVRLIQPRDTVLQADELREHFTERTKLFCTSWVNSFTGHAADVQSLGAVSRANNVLLLLNGSQAIGTRGLDVATAPVDAVTSCGFKWLCGPYGTGFCWIRPELRDSLEYNQAYWLRMQGGRTLNLMREREITVRNDLGASAYDVFCTANFLNFMPWTASVEYLLRQPIEQIEMHYSTLVSAFIDGLDSKKYELISPRQEIARSTLVVATHKQPDRNIELYGALKDEGIDVALREGNLRLSPHLHNRTEDIDRILSVLNAAA
jgi:cysteine desulfurase / selenocysteine lyase